MGLLALHDDRHVAGQGLAAARLASVCWPVPKDRPVAEVNQLVPPTTRGPALPDLAAAAAAARLGSVAGEHALDASLLSVQVKSEVLAAAPLKVVMVRTCQPRRCTTALMRGCRLPLESSSRQTVWFGDTSTANRSAPVVWAMRRHSPGAPNTST